MADGARQRAELLGIQLDVRDAGQNGAAQVRDISELLQKRPDLLLVAPVNGRTVAPAIHRANRARVPVISVDRRCAGGRVLCHIGSDNTAGGRMAADVIRRRLRGSGRIVELEGTSGTAAAQERGAGFNSALAAHPSLKVVARATADFDRLAARQRMKALLDQRLDFDGVFAHNDSMILGALEALEARDRSVRPVLVGFDGIPEAVQAVRSGRLSATIAQQPARMGELALESAALFFRGKTPAANIAVRLELIEAASAQGKARLPAGETPLPPEPQLPAAAPPSP